MFYGMTIFEFANNLLEQLFIDISKGTDEEKQVYKEIIFDFLKNRDILSLVYRPHHRLVNRLMHCLHVSYCCFLTSYRHSMDYKSAAIGGLLHDFCLSDKGDNKRKSFRDFWCFYHQQKALEESEKRFSLSERSKDIISKHMFPMALSIPRYKETWLIAYWDKYCAVKEVFKTKKKLAMAVC